MCCIGGTPLNNRQVNLLLRLYESKAWVLGKDLAKIFHVTDRTIRNDILKITQYYGPGLIISHARLGYSVNIEQYDSVVSSLEEKPYLDSDERIVYIIQELLFKNGELDLFELQETLYVSASSIDQDIKKIRDMLSNDNHLKLVRKSYRLSLEGSEEDKRLFYKNMLYQETTGNFLNINHISDLFNNIDLMELKNKLEELATRHSYKLNDRSVPRILMHLGISLERMLNGNYAPPQVGQEVVIDEATLVVVNAFFDYLAVTYDIEVRESEITIFSILLMGKKGLSERQALNQDRSVLIGNIVTQIIDDLDNIFGIDIASDEEFKLGLQLHFFSLMERDSHQEQADHFFIEDIKRRYPLIFEIACRIGNSLKQDLGLIVNESEIAFISLHLGSAFERLAYANRHRAILIYPYNKSLAQQYATKIDHRFDERLEIVEVLGFVDDDKIAAINPDLILTIAPLQLKFEGPVLELSVFFDNKDESQILDALTRVESIKTKKHFKLKMLDLFSKDLFTVGKTFDSSADIIQYMGQQAIDYGFASEGYVSSVFERESMSSTDFNYGIAVPHSVNASFTLGSGLGIMLLENPIVWGHFEVRVIIMLTITKEDHVLLRTFFDWLNDILSEPHYYSELLNIKSYDELIKMITAET